jgi:hypothetical protein
MGKGEASSRDEARSRGCEMRRVYMKWGALQPHGVDLLTLAAYTDAFLGESMEKRAGSHAPRSFPIGTRARRCGMMGQDGREARPRRPPANRLGPPFFSRLTT